MSMGNKQMSLCMCVCLCMCVSERMYVQSPHFKRLYARVNAHIRCVRCLDDTWYTRVRCIDFFTQLLMLTALPHTQHCAYHPTYVCFSLCVCVPLSLSISVSVSPPLHSTSLPPSTLSTLQSRPTTKHLNQGELAEIEQYWSFCFAFVRESQLRYTTCKKYIHIHT